MMHTQKGYNTGFKDCYGVEIHVGDKVVEGCNLRVSTVCWDAEQGTYKMKGLGNYYISDANAEWMVIESFKTVKDGENLPYVMTLEEHDAIENDLHKGERMVFCRNPYSDISKDDLER